MEALVSSKFKTQLKLEILRPQKNDFYCMSRFMAHDGDC